MNDIVARVRKNPRIIASLALPAALLLALIVATGGNFFSGGSGSSGSTGGTSAPPPTPAPTAAGRVGGVVTAQAHRLGGHAWSFVYIVHNTGKTPIAGFELYARPSNLFAVTGVPTWAIFGTGVCHSGPAGGPLVYWSTGTTNPAAIAPGKTARFTFKVNTGGVGHVGYSLSWGSANPLFGNVEGPAPSTLPASARCK